VAFQLQYAVGRPASGRTDSAIGSVIPSAGVRVSEVTLERNRPSTVIPSGARNLARDRHSERSEESGVDGEILRFAQDDDLSQDDDVNQDDEGVIRMTMG
jgi:hypothetical protein